LLKATDIIPIGATLLIEMDEVEEKTGGGIILPDAIKEQRKLSSSTAKIIALGDEAFLDFEKKTPMPEEGEHVIVATYCGKTINTKQGNYKICKDEDVIAVIRSK